MEKFGLHYLSWINVPSFQYVKSKPFHLLLQLVDFNVILLFYLLGFVTQ